MFEFFHRWFGTGDIPRPKGRLPALLADYPPYPTPFPGYGQTLGLAECEENLRSFLSVREERLEIVGGLLREFGLDLRAGLAADDPRPFLASLDRWAREEWPAAWTTAFPRGYGAGLSSPKEGEHIVLAMLMDVAIAIGEIVVRKRPDYAWRLDLAGENSDMGSYRRVVVAKAPDGPGRSTIVLDYESVCIDTFDVIGRGSNYDVSGRRTTITSKVYVPPPHRGAPLGSMAKAALEGGDDPPDGYRSVLPPEEAPPEPPPGADGPHVYDKAEYHAHVLEHEYGFDPEEADEQAAVPTAFFFGWLASHSLLSRAHMKFARQEIAAYRERRVTAVELWSFFDRCLIDDMLSDEGNAFTHSYFQMGDEPGFYRDLADTLAKGLTSVNHVPYTFENQARMDAVVDRRYAQWWEKAQEDGTLLLPPWSRPTREARAGQVAAGARGIAVRTVCAWTVVAYLLTWAPVGPRLSGPAYAALCFGGAAVFLPLVFLLVRAFGTRGNKPRAAACAQSAALLAVGMLVYAWPAAAMLLDGRHGPQKGDGKFFVLGAALLAAGVWRAPKEARAGFWAGWPDRH
ncbi:MAG: hypothetical protein ACRC20_13245 [Segniliparus sp.]|uniref:DUF7832 domain-containing protein n=1 Tax=Segniliparus sp. TaxID=2804064 RepID=UPI003F2F2E5F